LLASAGALHRRLPKPRHHQLSSQSRSAPAMKAEEDHGDDLRGDKYIDAAVPRLFAHTSHSYSRRLIGLSFPSDSM